VAVDVGEKAKETKEENSFRQKQRSVCKKNLTGPTLLEMSGYPTSMIGLCQEGKGSPDALGGARV
jgi:hypothetical protein